MIKWFLKTINSTTKQLLWFVTITYAIQVGVSMWIKTKYDIDLSQFLVFTSPVYSGMCLGYLTKSYKENSNKFGNNQENNNIEG